MSDERTTAPTRTALSLRPGDRRTLRRQVVETWLLEEPGDRNIRRTYTYEVETLRNGDVITLSRPTRLNKGMDFVINCPGFDKYKNGNLKPPKHKDLCMAVAVLASRSSQAKETLRKALAEVWVGKEPDDVLKGVPRAFDDLALERILKLAKWMFIEQDLTYWTESGRWMFRRGLEDIVGTFE